MTGDPKTKRKGGAKPARKDLLQGTVRVPEHVVYRSFPAETVVLNLKTGRYHGLNPTGGRMLEVLDRVGRVAEAAEQLVAEYGKPRAEIERDLGAFCADLAKRELIEVDASERD
jgi:hypothetical protein